MKLNYFENVKTEDNINKSWVEKLKIDNEKWGKFCIKLKNELTYLKSKDNTNINNELSSKIEILNKELLLKNNIINNLTTKNKELNEQINIQNNQLISNNKIIQDLTYNKNIYPVRDSNNISNLQTPTKNLNLNEEVYELIDIIETQKQEKKSLKNDLIDKINIIDDNQNQISDLKVEISALKNKLK